jgi:preprotein translocase subunit SecD
MVYFSKWKVITVLAIVVIGFFFASPNLLDPKTNDSIPDWIPHNQVNLGLDLQGGSHLLLEVQVSAVIAERVTSLGEGIRDGLRPLRRDSIRYGLSVGRERVSVNVRNPQAGTMERVQRIMTAVEPNLKVNVEGNRISVTYNEEALAEIKQSAVEQSIEIVRRRIDETGTKEPTIQRQGDDRILLQLPGVDDPERVKRLLGRTAKMTFHLMCPTGGVQEALSGRVPPGCALLQSAESNRRSDSGAPRQFLVRKRVEVSGDRLIDAQPTFEQRTNDPVVSFRFDTVGGKKFGDITRANVNQPFAIVLDNEVITAPVIREPILGGSGQISGGFTTADTRDLALLLRAGALPAPLTILEERTVGPGLGADSIAAGEFASMVGLILVVVFMVLTYGLFGFFASVALFVNMVLILALLSALQATLTLPGIAGIVLTIGMAVDANVLVFERIREEVRAGRTPISAIDAGYSRALTTIVDANLTTLIAAAILFQFGSGPIKGFAVTLIFGIITSMFTAIMLTRLMVVAWIRRKRPTEVPL